MFHFIEFPRVFCRKNTQLTSSSLMSICLVNLGWVKISSRTGVNIFVCGRIFSAAAMLLPFSSWFVWTKADKLLLRFEQPSGNISVIEWQSSTPHRGPSCQRISRPFACLLGTTLTTNKTKSMIFNQFYLNYHCSGIGKQPSKSNLAFLNCHQYYLTDVSFSVLGHFGKQL